MIQDYKVQEYSAQEIIRDIHIWMKRQADILSTGNGFYSIKIPLWEWNNMKHNLLYLLETFSTDLDEIGDLDQIQKREEKEK